MMVSHTVINVMYSAMLGRKPGFVPKTSVL